jgi:transcriptional regulator of met regulon
VCARWLPKNLTDDHKFRRAVLTLMHLTRDACQGEQFLHGFVTGDET